MTADDAGGGRPPGPAWPTASTGLVALLGQPVDHSLSPPMHNAAFRELDLDHVYLALPTPEDALGVVVAALGAVGAVGANVTVPHKQAVMASCEVLTEEAELVGAVNTLAWTTDGLLGDNTDATGLHASLVDDVGLSPGTPAVVLGTGGAARAAMVALGRLEAPVAVVGRRPDAAERLAELAGRAGAPESRGVDLADTGAVRAAVGGAGLIINATPLGMAGEPLPDPFHELGPEQVAYDLVYNPTTPQRASGQGTEQMAVETPFLRAARERGAGAHNGLGMLVAQAGRSFQRWTGRAPPLSTMSAVATAAVARSGRSGPA